MSDLVERLQAENAELLVKLNTALARNVSLTAEHARLQKQLDELTPVKVVACDRCHQFFEDPGKPVKQCPDCDLVDAGGVELAS